MTLRRSNTKFWYIATMPVNDELTRAGPQARGIMHVCLKPFSRSASP